MSSKRTKPIAEVGAMKVDDTKVEKEATGCKIESTELVSTRSSARLAGKKATVEVAVKARNRASSTSAKGEKSSKGLATQIVHKPAKETYRRKKSEEEMIIPDVIPSTPYRQKTDDEEEEFTRPIPRKEKILAQTDDVCELEGLNSLAICVKDSGRCEDRMLVKARRESLDRQTNALNLSKTVWASGRQIDVMRECILSEVGKKLPDGINANEPANVSEEGDIKGSVLRCSCYTSETSDVIQQMKGSISVFEEKKGESTKLTIQFRTVQKACEMLTTPVFQLDPSGVKKRVLLEWQKFTGLLFEPKTDEVTVGNIPPLFHSNSTIMESFFMYFPVNITRVPKSDGKIHLFCKNRNQAKIVHSLLNEFMVCGTVLQIMQC